MNRDEVIETANTREMQTYNRIDVVAVRGEGSWIVDADGTRYLDLYGGHAVALLGHAPPRVADAITIQARDLLFYSNAVHVPARARAAERLVRIAPWDDAQVLFLNSGAEANETALKMARKATGRNRVVAFHGGFHGRTLGALACCGMEKYRGPAAPWVDPSDAVRFGTFNGDADMIDESCAAVLVEPIQSMGGMHVMTESFARALRARCDDSGALLIFDEVQTAPARTGHWFAGDRWGLRPDVITTAKGLAAGFPAGAVLASGSVAASVKPGDQGTTFGGGPVACAAVDATIAELEEIDGPARARAIEAQIREGLPGREVLGWGALLGVRAPAGAVATRLREDHRVLVGGCPGDPTVIRLFPPLNISGEDLEAGLAALRSAMP